LFLIALSIQIIVTSVFTFIRYSLKCLIW